MKKPFIEAGRITNTHGVHGALKIEVWLDSAEAFCRYRRVFIDGAERKLRSARAQNRFAVAELEGIDSVNAAMPLKGKSVYIAREDAQLPPGGYFLQDLINARVLSEDGAEVGVLTEILERPANNVYVVRSPAGREVLIPAVPAFILRANPDAGVVTVRLLEGM